MSGDLRSISFLNTFRLSYLAYKFNISFATLGVDEFSECRELPTPTETLFYIPIYYISYVKHLFYVFLLFSELTELN